MAGSLNNDDDVISGINVTPLVDVVLVLLIIFMITAPVIYQSAIKIQLPKAKTGDTLQARQNHLNFSINAAGEISWEQNGKSEKMDFPTLDKRLAAMSAGGALTEMTAMISADQNTPHGTVVKLMDILRQVGLVKFALNVESERK